MQVINKGKKVTFLTEISTLRTVIYYIFLTIGKAQRQLSKVSRRLVFGPARKTL